jgi:glutamyl-Q tRNA(Asp) synthetase
MTDPARLSGYTGRFAPSPSGPLHFGSLVAAVASYLDARANHGTWLVRMEDLDPAREPPDAADTILQQLDDYGLQPDQPVLFQSHRLAAYQEALDALLEQGLCYPCTCSRQKVRLMGDRYDGSCLRNPPPAGSRHAIRVNVSDQAIEFEDLVQGHQSHNLARESGDFIIKRKDGLFAYQLAVAVDDAHQKISHVIRGHDLLESTPRQIFLQQKLRYPTPRYGHVPVATNELGQKLSKQHFAEPLSSTERNSILHAAIRFLGLSPPPKHHQLSISEQLDWAISNWHIQNVPKLATIPQHTPSS